MSLVYMAPAAQPGAKRNNVYLGGKSDAKDRTKLEQRNVTHILNMTPSKDSSIQAGVPNYFEKSKAFQYKRISVYDAPASAADLLEQAPAIVEFIHKGLYHGSVLVHCHHGVSRSTTAVLFYLISSKVGMSLEEGLTTIRRRRPEVQPIPAFYTILQKYEASQQQEIKKNSTTSTTISSQAKPKRPPNQPSIGPAIGPSPPPSKKQKQDTSNKTEESSASAIGPLMPPKVNNQPIIGPIPPPPTETQRNTDRDESERKKTSIGPEMPPSTNQK